VAFLGGLAHNFGGVLCIAWWDVDFEMLDTGCLDLVRMWDEADGCDICQQAFHFGIVQMDWKIYPTSLRGEYPVVQADTSLNHENLSVKLYHYCSKGSNIVINCFDL
jgi:hypothetical protein